MNKADLSHIKLVIFDWDGTLMDSVDKIVGCMQAASCDAGVATPSEQEVKEIIGLGLKESIQQLFPQENDDMHGVITEQYRQHYLFHSEIKTELFVGAYDTLAQLKEAGYVLAVATGKARRGLDRVLGDTGVGQFFDTTRCSDETQSKPHPQMLHEIMDSLAIPAQATLMVGDTEFDLKMASAAGVDSLAVSYGVHKRERLLSHNPVACIDDIREITSLLRDFKVA